jgi:hypothetical protein
MMLPVRDFLTSKGSAPPPVARTILVRWAVLSLGVILAGCAALAGLDDFGPAEHSGHGGAEGGGGPGGTGNGATGGLGPSVGGSMSGGAPGSGGSSSTSAPSSGGGAVTTGVGAGGQGGFGDCFDGRQNGSESDVDCGGGCKECFIGKQCNGPLDCTTAHCVGQICVCNDHLVISEIRSRGTSGASDEFVEIFNATPAGVILDDTWSIEGRNATGAQYVPRWVGSGDFIGSHEHLLVVGSGYAQSPSGDASLSAGITDEASVVLKHGGVVVDAVCYCGLASTSCALFGAGGFSCEGTPMTNPNASGVDENVSIRRKAGALSGSCIDTANNGADFDSSAPAAPQNLASPPTPTQ